MPGYPGGSVGAFNRLITAHHEAGHAVAHVLGGGRVTEVKILGERSGVMVPKENTPIPGRELEFLAMILAGHEAGVRFLTTYGGFGRSAANRALRKAGAHDLARFPGYARGTGISESTARSRARSLVASHWGRIHRVAVKLDRSGRLTHGQI